jgi:EAL domain-containing protein (putative c-di-GMP-specific phosphodiesterase class I)
VLGEACRQAAVWSHAMRHRVTIGVNVAAPQIADASFAAITEAVLDRHGLQPDQLILDVTEASLSMNPDAAARVVAALRATGVRVAVDDFGIGPSSISLLHEVGADIVKIDRSVIAHLDVDPHTVPFVRSLVRLADGLGMTVIAEGIERPEQLDQLLDLGCQLGQGHLLARPMDAVAVLETLVARGSASRP